MPNRRGRPRTVKLALNLDNIRCLFYGKNASDRVDEALYLRPLLPSAVAVETRLDFLREWFSDTVPIHALLESWDSTQNVDPKKRDSNLSELSSGNVIAARSGIISILRDVGAEYSSLKITESPIYVKLYKLITEQDASALADTLSRLSMYLETLRRAELNNPVLLQVLDKLQRWTTTAKLVSSPASTAYILTILLLAALTRDVFPFALLKPYTAALPQEAQYAIGMVVNSMTINLAVAQNQIQSLENYLQSEESALLLESGDTDAYWKLQTLHIIRAEVLTNNTDIEKLCPDGAELNMSSLLFLHHLPFCLGTTVKVCAEQVLSYKKTVFASKEGLKSLLLESKTFLEHMKALIYWHIVAACLHLPDKHVQELHEFVLMLDPSGSNQFIEHVELLTAAPEEKIHHAEMALKTMLAKSHLHMPDTFIGLHLSETIQALTSTVSHPRRIICAGTSPQQTVADTFLDTFRLLDALIVARYSLLSMFLDQTEEKKIPPDETERIIEQYSHVFRTYLDLPYLQIDGSMISFLMSSGIQAIELESFARQPIVEAHEFFIFIGNLRNALRLNLSAVQQTCRLEKISMLQEIQYYRSLPDYFFLTCPPEMREGLAKSSDAFRLLHFSFQPGMEYQKEAEKTTTKILDQLEDGILSIGHMIQDEEWTLMEARSTVQEIKRKITPPSTPSVR